jgi:hypothetical protein
VVAWDREERKETVRENQKEVGAAQAKQPPERPRCCIGNGTSPKVVVPQQKATSMPTGSLLIGELQYPCLYSEG